MQWSEFIKKYEGNIEKWATFSKQTQDCFPRLVKIANFSTLTLEILIKSDHRTNCLKKR